MRDAGESLLLPRGSKALEEAQGLPPSVPMSLTRPALEVVCKPVWDAD